MEIILAYLQCSTVSWNAFQNESVLPMSFTFMTLPLLTWQIMIGRRGVSGAPATPLVAADRGQGHDGAWTV